MSRICEEARRLFWMRYLQKRVLFRVYVRQTRGPLRRKLPKELPSLEEVPKVQDLHCQRLGMRPHDLHLLQTRILHALPKRLVTNSRLHSLWWPSPNWCFQPVLPILPRNNIVEASPCTRKLKGIGMFFAIPLVLVGSVLFSILLLAVCIGICLFCTPCMAKSICFLPYLVSIIFYPIVFALVLLGSLFSQIPRVCMSIGSLCLKYFKTTRGYLFYEDKEFEG